MNFNCSFNNCNEIATCGYIVGDNLFCKDHSKDDMLITFKQEQILLLEDYKFKKYRKCFYKECELEANYNFPEQKPICCKTHQINGMIDVKHSKCCFKGCSTRPNFNFEGIKKATYCKEHADKDMVDVLAKKCFCNKVQPNFNYIGLKPKYCASCKLVDMVDVSNIKCECGKAANYNFIGLKGKYCSHCKTSEMINVNISRCKCGKSEPYFNYIGLKREFCSACKLPDMVNVFSTKCNCGKVQPIFNFTGLIARYCSACKLPDMIDVSNKKCQCGKSANFNYSGLKAEYCSKCKLPDMIDVSNKKCQCGKSSANFNYSGLKAEYCSKCKLKDMVNVNVKTCKNSWCNTSVNNPQYKDYCFRCFIYEFPDQKISKNYKVKEKYVTDYLEETFPNKFIFDKTVGGCSKRRPDAYLDLYTHIIIVECDENQHTDYDITCEIARINELFTDLGDRPIVFIRFNPDAYSNKPSSFKYHKTSGVPMIRDINEWNGRLEILKNCIDQYIQTIPSETKFKYLFYDSKNKIKVNIKIS
jgi:hypothetical protein